MTSEERKQKILEILNKENTVKVNALSKYFKTSEVTIRSDLADMESKGLLSRIHGGAISSYKPYYTMNSNQRISANQPQKTIVAKKISSMIENNDTVMINSGTTTLLAFRMLPENINLSIVTNSVAIALEAAENPNYNIVLLGGCINSKYQFSFGSDAMHQLKKYHADKLILSVDGIDIKSGLSTYYDKEAEIARLMLEQSDLKIVAADSSKFNRSAFAKISDLNVVDYIVTDEDLPEKTVKDFAKKKIIIK